MAKRVFIPVSDHNEPGICTNFYNIRYKPASISSWTDLINQQAVLEGSPAIYGLVINNLSDDITYDYEIIRHCCPETTGTGINSLAASGTFLTTT